MEEDKAQEQFDNAYPEPLRKHALSCKLTGGEFNFDRMNFIEKMLIRKISGINDSVSKINNDKIQELVAEMSD
jgi:menaquinone-dependent protoporphyrinogen oxidase